MMLLRFFIGGVDHILDLRRQCGTLIRHGLQQGDAAWRLGRYAFSGESPEGEAISAKGEYIVLLVQKDGMWKIHRSVGFAPRHPPSEEMADDAM